LLGGIYLLPVAALALVLKTEIVEVRARTHRIAAVRVLSAAGPSFVPVEFSKRDVPISLVSHFN